MHSFPSLPMFRDTQDREHFRASFFHQVCLRRRKWEIAHVLEIVRAREPPVHNGSHDLVGAQYQAESNYVAAEANNPEWPHEKIPERYLLGILRVAESWDLAGASNLPETCELMTKISLD